MGKLKNAVRNVALTTKIPSGRTWYTSDVIDFDVSDELEIYPMSHKDELLMHNPDALFSNKAVSGIITSCVPAVKNPSKLYIPDVEALLLAIKIASVGDELEVYNVCPHCYEQYNLLSEEERNKLIEEKKLYINPQTFIFDARTCLEQMESLPPAFEVELNPKLIVSIKPLTLAENTEYEINNFQIQNSIQHFIRDSKNAEEAGEMLTDFSKWEENRNKNEIFNGLLDELDNITTKMLKASIKKVIYDNEEYTDDEDIMELLQNVDRNGFEKIKKCYEEASRSRLNKAYKCQCQYCGHEWTDDNINFNFSNFFATGS